MIKHLRLETPGFELHTTWLEEVEKAITWRERRIISTDTQHGALKLSAYPIWKLTRVVCLLNALRRQAEDTGPVLPLF